MNRIILGNVSDTEATTHEAGALGVTLTKPHSVTLVSQADEGSSGDHESDRVLVAMQQRVSEVCPDAIASVLSSGLLVVALQPHLPAVDAALSSAMESDSRVGLVIGRGTAATGIRGLALSYRQAGRAQALGQLLEPGIRIHDYARLRFFDIFKEGEPIRSFVEDELGPLLAVRSHRRRDRLIETLSSLSTCALNRKQAAYRLGIHSNTLTNRVHELEWILGNDPTVGETWFRTQLAVRLMKLAGRSG
ncbi:MAG: helix-turn-helix domain-containing protein [Candidatus Dormiibacterota bacterium]